MKKYVGIAAAMAMGIAICCFAPQAWRLVGVFSIGAGTYAITQILARHRIEREIERYERPEAEVPASRREPVLSFPNPTLAANFRFAHHGKPMVKAAA